MKLYLTAILFLFSSLLFCQSRSEVEKQIEKTKKQIEYTNELIVKTSKTKKQTYNKLLLVLKQIQLRKELINQLEEEVQIIEDSIIVIKKSLRDLKLKEDKLKKEYAKLIYFSYKNSNSYDMLMYILSAETFNKAYKRLKYLEQHQQYRRMQANKIIEVRDSLYKLVVLFEEKKLAKEKFLSEKIKENEKLTFELSRKKVLIKNLDKQKSKLEQELKKQLEQQEKLQEEIKKIIKREQELAIKKQKLESLKSLSKEFEKNEGKLPWPVDDGIVIREFGPYRHPVLNRDLNNDGIDISTSENAYAKCIFEGVVAKIIVIPGSNAAILVRHGEFLSVYTNIVDVAVQAGQKVKTNQKLGKIYHDKINGKSITQLQIWKENEKQNPKRWLQDN